MARIRVSVVIDAPRAVVWAALDDIGSHVEWMADADSIRFTSPTTSGLGTTFDCVTRVGPIRLTDRMEVTQYEPERVLGVRHVGLVTGTGRFTLGDTAGDRTELVWEEDLRFPPWMGATVGAFAARPVLRRIWNGNLRRLATLITVLPPGGAEV